MLRSIARGLQTRLGRGISIPLTGRRLSMTLAREVVTAPSHAVASIRKVPAAPEGPSRLDAMALIIANSHIDVLLSACPALRPYWHTDAGHDLPTALAFLEFCNNSVALFLPQSRNVHLRRQLMSLKARAPRLSVFIDRQIAALDLEDGVVERAVLLEGDTAHSDAYRREVDAYDASYEAQPAFLAEARGHLDLTGDVRGNSILWFIRQNLELFRGKRILHFGPEPLVSAFFHSDAHSLNCIYETSDGFSAIVDHLADLTSLALPDAAYDVVICHRVLEHVMDDRAALREIARVLRPGSLLDVSVPQSMNRAEMADWVAQDSSHHDHVRQYGRDFAERLEQAGFAVTVDRSLLTRSLADHNRDGTYPMRHYICRKRNGA